MGKGVWQIYCHVCGNVADGPPHGTTCFECERAGLKYCSACGHVLSLEEFYTRPDTGKRMTRCIVRYKVHRNATRRTDDDYIQRRNMQSRQCKHRKYDTPEGRTKEILRCHERRALAGAVDPAEWAECLIYFENSCAYCGSHGKLTVDHIIPISHFGAHKIYNIVPACAHCNSSKSDRDILDWYKKQPFYTVERLLKIHSWFKDQQRR